LIENAGAYSWGEMTISSNGNLNVFPGFGQNFSTGIGGFMGGSVTYYLK
jgi:hypothetical protein